MVKSTSRRIKSISKRPAGKAAPRKPAAPAKAPPKKPSAKAPAKLKWVFGFGNGKAEGRADMRNLLGGKGAGLAEMANLGLPVPPGFTITTAVCTHYYENSNAYPKNLQEQVHAALAQIGRITGKSFGDGDNPLLVSVRSGARASMPGMMDTVLNLGLNDATVEVLAKNSGDKRFAYDSYRRFITMYSDVVLGLGHHHFEEILDDYKDRNGYTLDTDLSADDWVDLVGRYKERLEDEHGAPFPQDPHEQLWGAISAVFGSWMNQRAIRRASSAFKALVRRQGRNRRPWSVRLYRRNAGCTARGWHTAQKPARVYAPRSALRNAPQIRSITAAIPCPTPRHMVHNA